MGRGGCPGDRLRPRLHRECRCVQRARPAPQGPLSFPRPRRPRARGERLVPDRGVSLRRSGERPGGIHPTAGARKVRTDRDLDGRHHRDGLCRRARQPAVGPVINDIGPDSEAGTQRITQMVGSRPDEFATLEEAMAYRRAMSPILAARSAADQRELALGVLRRGTGGKWGWKMDPAYIRQRVEHGAPARPPLWPALQALPCPTLVVWGTESDVLSEAQVLRMVDVLPRGELVRVPGIGHAPTLVEPVVLAALDRFLRGLHAR